MKIDEARDIYRTRYYVQPKIDKLSELIQPLVFDMSINHGPGTAIKLLQRVLNDVGNPCSVDGGLGGETLSCAESAVGQLGTELVNKLVERRIGFYHAIVDRDASQKVFLKGWLRRAREFLVS